MPASDRTIETEVAVLGGGTSGCVIAGRLAEAGRSVRSSRRARLRAAGGRRLAGGARRRSRDPGHARLGLRLRGSLPDWRRAAFQRARVLGGCSAHNGCIAAVGHRSDYDAWGLPGWSSADVEASCNGARADARPCLRGRRGGALSTPPASKPPRRRAGIARTTSASSTVSTGSVSRPSTSTPAFASTRPLRISIRSVGGRGARSRSSTVSSAARMAGGPTSYATTRR